jgi:hypothetical protein
VGGTAGPEPNGWLRAYLESSFEDIRCRISGLEEKVDSMSIRVSRLEGVRSESRRFWQAVRDWASPFITAIIGLWAILRGR